MTAAFVSFKLYLHSIGRLRAVGLVVNGKALSPSRSLPLVNEQPDLTFHLIQNRINVD